MTTNLNVSNFMFDTECANVNLIELDKSDRNREREMQKTVFNNNLSVY